MDIYKKLNPDASEKNWYWSENSYWCGRTLRNIMDTIYESSISGGLYTYLQSVQAYIAPPIASVFLLGLFGKELMLQERLRHW